MKNETKKLLKEFNKINSKLMKATLKEMLDEETFTATNKKSGKTVVFKSKETRDAAIKAGTHTKIKDTSKTDKPKKSSTQLSGDDFATDVEKQSGSNSTNPKETKFIQNTASTYRKILLTKGQGPADDFAGQSIETYMKNNGIDVNDDAEFSRIADLLITAFKNPTSTKTQHKSEDEFTQSTAKEYQETLDNEGESAAMDAIDNAIYDYMDSKGLDTDDEKEYDRISNLVWSKIKDVQPTESVRFNKRLLERAGIKRKK